uniref:Uncharacterized protein n=1 Tax=Equus caballus TaxID=9796 RepID=A0A9L0SQE1_HORSE
MQVLRLGTQRRRGLGRAHCSQLESRSHTVIFTPKSQKELAPRGLGKPAPPQISCLNQHDASRAPLCPVSLWGTEVGWSYQHPNLEKRGVSSQHTTSK